MCRPIKATPTSSVNVLPGPWIEPTAAGALS